MRSYGLTAMFVAAALLAACNMLSGADSLAIGKSTDKVDDVTEGEPDSGFKNGDGGGGHGGQTPPPASDASTTTTTIDGGVDAGVLATFTDDFARPDGPIGNDWVLKSPGKYTLSNGAVKQTGTGVFADLVNHRPSSEDGLNFETSFTVTIANTNGDPAVYARIQPGSDANNYYRSYAFYPGGLDGAYLEREDVDHTTSLASSAINPKLTTGTPYRVTLKVTGTNPVHLEGTIDTLTGSRLATVVFDDADGNRISTPGSVGFGSGDANNARFDDFKRVTLP